MSKDLLEIPLARADLGDVAPDRAQHYAYRHQGPVASPLAELRAAAKQPSPHAGPVPQMATPAKLTPAAARPSDRSGLPVPRGSSRPRAPRATGSRAHPRTIASRTHSRRTIDS